MAKSGTKILFGFLFFVILVGGLSGGGAWYLTENRVEGYRASATLLLPAPEKEGDGPPPLRAPGDGPEDKLRGHLEASLGIAPPRHEAISAPDLATLFSSDHVASKLQEKMAGLYTELGLEARAWALEEVRDAMEAEAEVALQTHNKVVYRRLVNIRFTAENPTLAAAATNAWAGIADALARDLVADETEARRAALEDRLGRIQAELNPAQETLDALRQETPVDLLEEAAHRAAEALMDMEGSVRELEQQLARDEAALGSLKSYVTKAPVAVVLELSVREADLQAKLAGTQAERDYLAGQVEPLRVAQSAAQTRWAEARKSLESVEGTVLSLAPQAAYLNQALAMVATPSLSLKLAAPAVAPERPVGPHRYILVGGAAIVGAILGMILYFALLTLRVYARELDQS